MQTLIRLAGGQFSLAQNSFTHLADEDAMVAGDLILSLARFHAEGDALISQGRSIGVRIAPEDEVEGLAYDLPRLALVAPVFPKFRDGRAYTTATLLRQRLGYGGEVRAVGEVLREQAGFMVRCGFDAFEPADGSSAEQWAHAAQRQRHVYQRAADDRAPAFVERVTHGL